MSDQEQNIRVMTAVVAAFDIPKEQREEIMDRAMVRCLSKHEDGRQQFTSSLYRFTTWECQNAIRQRARSRRVLSLSDVPEPPCPVDDRKEDIDHMYECMEMLSPKDRSVIDQYYFQELTLEEIGDINRYTRQAACANLARAVDRLRKLCLRD